MNKSLFYRQNVILENYFKNRHAKIKTVKTLTVNYLHYLFFSVLLCEDS